MAAQTDPLYAMNGRVIVLSTDSVTGVVTGATAEIPLDQLAAAILAGAGLSIPVPVASGGTGATTQAGAQANLGIGTLGVQNANAVGITGGTIDGTPVGSIAQSTIDATAIGSIAPGTGVFTDVHSGTIETSGLATLATADINGGTIDATVIGGVTPAAAAVTTLSASGNDALLYRTTNAQSFASGTPATVTTWTQVFDRLGANFNAATGVFTAPVTGIYHVCAGLSFAANTGAIGTNGMVIVNANAVQQIQGVFNRQTATSVSMPCNAACDVSLAAGQTIIIQGLQNTGGAVALSGTALSNYVSIHRVP